MRNIAAWRRCSLLAALFVVAAGCDWQAATMPAPSPPADPLMDVVDREGSVVVVVDLAVPQGSAASSDPVTLISRAQRKLMSELGAGAQVVDRFRRRSPRLTLRVDARALTELRQSSLVVNISLAEPGEPTQ